MKTAIVILAGVILLLLFVVFTMAEYIRLQNVQIREYETKLDPIVIDGEDWHDEN